MICIAPRSGTESGRIEQNQGAKTTCSDEQRPRFHAEKHHVLAYKRCFSTKYVYAFSSFM